MEKNLKLQGWTSELQGKVKEVVTYDWDVIFEDGSRRPIQGFLLHIYTGNHPTICCKPHSYGSHEYEVMQNLVGQLYENSVVEEDNGP